MALCKGKEIAVYPGFDGALPGTPVGKADIDAWSQWWSKRRAGSSTEAGSN